MSHTACVKVPIVLCGKLMFQVHVVFCGLHNLFQVSIQPVFKYMYYSVSCTACVQMPVVFCGLYNLFPSTCSILRAIQPVFKCLYQCFPNVFAHGPHLALKNNHYRSSHPCSHKYRMSRWYISKIKNFYLGTDFR